MRRMSGSGAAVALALALGMSGSARGQVGVRWVPAAMPVLMLSDLHFDPFHDPEKVARLDGAPVGDWDRILQEPASAGQAAGYAAIQTACKARGDDTDIDLLNSVLKGAKAQAAGVKFVTVSGDLLVHLFECRYHEAMKGKDEGRAAFAEKTAVYVVRRVEAAFPAVPVYAALGNNDSGCGDYRMNVRDRFLAGTSGAMLQGLRGVNPVEFKKAKETYERGGYYGVSLPGMGRTRLLVLNDLYMSNKYAGCEGQKDDAGAAAEMKWLQGELDSARALGWEDWVMGHIPPGVDIYSTLRHVKTMCTAAPEKFLASDALATMLEHHGDVVRLAIFGHTHTDEVRLLGDVPAKLVGSVSPINGNTPSFTVAQANAGSAMLENYAVFTASNPTGVGTTWAREYDFREAYQVEDFSAKSLRGLIANFRAEPTGKASAEYERNFFGGDGSPLPLVWPQYMCALDHTGGTEFHECLCPAQ